MNNTIYYFDFSKKGIDLFGVKDVPIIKNGQAIREAVFNLLSTQKGSVPMYPERGIDLDRLLFEPIDDITTELISSEIKNGLKTFENRIYDIKINIESAEDNHTYDIEVSFKILYNNETEVLKFNSSKLR